MLKVLFVASECVPFAKTGGLADVVGSLPQALKHEKSDMDVRVILPKHRCIPQVLKESLQHLQYFYLDMGWRRQYCGIEMLEMDGITYYFMDNEYFFGRDTLYTDGNDDAERYAFFSRAVLETLSHIDFYPDIMHCHDWQTGMVCALLKTQYAQQEAYAAIKTVFTIHNLKFQGIYDWQILQDLLELSDELNHPDALEYYGNASFMKGGLVFADHITTVSPTYAREIEMPYYGEGLHGLLASRHDDVTGILNGIDLEYYNPHTDSILPGHYSSRSLKGKSECKRQLQKELGFTQEPDTPIMAMVSRLSTQKGLDLVSAVLHEMLSLPLQMIVLGKGEQRYADMFNWAQWNYGGRMVAHIGMDEPLSRRIYAAADLFLMPSQFEPCGISQMIAMRYGAVPIVRHTGGLRDSVVPEDDPGGKGNGFVFHDYNAHDMLHQVEQAVDMYHNERERFDEIRLRGMRRDFSWKRSAKSYLQLYNNLL